MKVIIKKITIENDKPFNQINIKVDVSEENKSQKIEIKEDGEEND